MAQVSEAKAAAAVVRGTALKVRGEGMD